MGLFKPAWMSKNESRAFRALDDARRSGYGDWQEAAKHAPLPSVRHEAYRRLREAFLATPEHKRPFLFGTYFDLGNLAGYVVDGIDGPERLIELVKNGEGGEIRLAAARAFRSRFDLLAPELDQFDDDSLGIIAKECGDLGLALHAAGLFAARKPGGYNLYLCHAIKNSSSGVSQEEALGLIAAHADNPSVVEGLICRVHDDGRLRDIALASRRRGLVVTIRDLVEDPSIRQEVADHLERIDKAAEKEERRAQRRAEKEGRNASREEFRALADRLESGKGAVVAREIDAVVGDLTDPRDVERALVLADYRDTWDLNNLFDLPKSNTWKLLCRQSDKRLLKRVAAKAKSEAIRWKACKMLGGHFPAESSSPNRCRCALCGFEVHVKADGSSNVGPWTCERCGGSVETPGFATGYPASLITYPDGTRHAIRGYDGLVGSEGAFVERENLA